MYYIVVESTRSERVKSCVLMITMSSLLVYTMVYTMSSYSNTAVCVIVQQYCCL
jgi:hypothetical protein